MRKDIFSKDNIGHEVNCLVNGNGVITGLNYNSSKAHIVEVEFKHNHVTRYTTCGRCDYFDAHPTLSFNHKKDYVFDYGTPKRVYVPLKFTGRPMWCGVGPKEDIAANLHFIRQVVAQVGTEYSAMSLGLSNTKTLTVTKHAYAMALTDKELDERGLSNDFEEG